MVNDDTAPATKKDLLTLQGELKADMDRRFETVDAQFKFVAALIETSNKEAGQQMREGFEGLSQEIYNKTTEQDVVIGRHDKRIGVVERRVGIAA
jgi:hypothetical protein